MSDSIMFNPIAQSYDTYSYGATINIPEPNRACFTLSPAFKFSNIREAVAYADAISAQTKLDCTATATKSSSNGSVSQNVVYKVIIVHGGDFNPEKVLFWHCPMHIISHDVYTDMSEQQRNDMKDTYGADFFAHV